MHLVHFKKSSKTGHQILEYTEKNATLLRLNPKASGAGAGAVDPTATCRQ
jgi:hypothetical protein